MKSDSPINEQTRRRRERLAIVAVLTLLVLLSLLGYFIMERSLPHSPANTIILFGILNINILLILFVLFLIVRHLVKAIFEDRQHLLGAKLRTKLVIAFVSLSLLPTLLLFWISFQFLKTSVTYWFDIKVERALENAINIGKTYLDDQTSMLQTKGREIERFMSRRCVREDGSFDRGCLEGPSNPLPFTGESTDVNHFTGIHSLEVLDAGKNVLASRTWLPLLTAPPAISDELARSVLEGEKIRSASDSLENGLLLRVAMPLHIGPGHEPHILAVGAFIPQDTTQLLEEIRVGYEDYSQLFLYQNPIKGLIFTTLFLITLLIIFVSIWFGFRIARGITEPVRMLSEATRRIALGDLEVRLDSAGKDELSGLIKAFNTMTRDIKEARRRAEISAQKLKRSNAELESRRRYTEIVLENVAAGVISMDRDGIITTMNRSAEEILGLASEEFVGRPYTQVLKKEQIEEFEAIRGELLRSRSGTIQRPIRLTTGAKLVSLLVNFSLLHDADGKIIGIVIVFEDLTELERIQRIAAWREVARRVAHEVKNPLTPIQLSAQRLRKKYMEGLEPATKEVFDRCTATIIEQVEDLKRLVNEFSNFARMPAPSLAPTHLTPIIEDLSAMYREGYPEITFAFDGEEGLPEVLADPDQIKRAVINLIENAIAAMPGGGDLSVRLSSGEEGRDIRIEVADTGTGIPPEDRKRLFEPYFSRKKGGTGLGLSIVHSIVTDHGGKIIVEDNLPAGTRFTMVLPAHMG